MLLNGKTHYFDWAMFNGKLSVITGRYGVQKWEMPKTCRQLMSWKIRKIRWMRTGGTTIVGNPIQVCVVVSSQNVGCCFSQKGFKLGFIIFQAKGAMFKIRVD